MLVWEERVAAKDDLPTFELTVDSVILRRMELRREKLASGPWLHLSFCPSSQVFGVHHNINSSTKPWGNSFSGVLQPSFIPVPRSSSRDLYSEIKCDSFVFDYLKERWVYEEDGLIGFNSIPFGWIQLNNIFQYLHTLGIMGFPAMLHGVLLLSWMALRSRPRQVLSVRVPISLHQQPSLAPSCTQQISTAPQRMLVANAIDQCLASIAHATMCSAPDVDTDAEDRDATHPSATR